MVPFTRIFWKSGRTEQSQKIQRCDCPFNLAKAWEIFSPTQDLNPSTPVPASNHYTK